MVLEVVVGVGDVVLAGVDVLGRDVDPAVVGLQIIPGRGAVQIAPVREAAPGGVDLGDVAVVAPVAGLHQGQDAGPVRAGLGAEDPGGRPAVITVVGQVGGGVGADEVLLVRLVEVGDQPYGVVEHGHHVREGVAEEAGDPYGDVDPRSLQLGQRDDLEVDHAARHLVPHRQHAQQGEDLGDVVAGGAHGRRAPDRQPDGTGVVAGVGEVAGQQRLGHRLPGLERQPGRDRLRVDGVEVATRRAAR